MGLIPEVVDDLLPDYTEEPNRSYTYAIVIPKGRIRGKCDGEDAVKQAIYKILNTERYDYPVYSDDYGIEIKDLIGMPDDYCMSELERRIKEALLRDDRIDDVSDFLFKIPKKGMIHVTFNVTTDTEQIEAEAEVSV